MDTQARPMMMLAETCIIGGAMDGYSHLSIAEREDIMVRRKGHEGASQIARELPVGPYGRGALPACPCV